MWRCVFGWVHADVSKTPSAYILVDQVDKGGAGSSVGIATDYGLFFQCVISIHSCTNITKWNDLINFHISNL